MTLRDATPPGQMEARYRAMNLPHIRLPDRNKKCRLKQNVMGRWILVHPELEELGWSGSAWVEMDRFGLGKEVQVSNFLSEDQAFEYAKRMGFTTITVNL